MKTGIVIATIFLTAANFVLAQTPETNAVLSPPREGDIVPAPGPRDRAYGISGPGAKHTTQWTNYNSQCTGSAVTNGLIPNLKPLIPDTQLRDTIVILGGNGNYYMTGSSGADIWDFNDGIELWRSADLKKWDYVGEVWSFDKDGTWEKDWRWHRKPVRAIWAPEIHYIKRLNNYFLAISMPPGNRGILKSVNGKPEGPYVNALANDGYFHGGIDATLFEDDDGKVYFTSGGAGSIALMKDDMSGFDGEPHRIEFEKPADGSWTRNSIAMEGASLFKRNGIYYLGGAAFYKGRYSSVVAMSTNIFGPYKNWEEAVPCGGGTDYFQDKDGNWWDAYFGNDNQSPFREKPAIVKVDFDKDGKIFVAKDQPDFVLVPPAPVILTPKPAATPRINGPKIFGVRPGSPFLYSIPATGDRPMTFTVDDLPAGLRLDPATGQITGKLPKLTRAPANAKGSFFLLHPNGSRNVYDVTLHAKNALGVAEKQFRIVVGEDIALTPAMGWNSYNCFGTSISEDRELGEARAMVASGLAQHGWTYVNMDDGWSARQRGGPLHALQADPRRFTDMKAMVDQIHAMGLKAGLYSSPWTITYGGHLGSTSKNPDGAWPTNANMGAKKNARQLPFAIGNYSFVTNDAAQFAEWGFDYLKYDWGPVEAPETKEMYQALCATHRDIVFSLSNNHVKNLFKDIGEVSKWAESWRTTTDINDNWKRVALDIGFAQDAWAPFARPGHFNDPDMLVVGQVGWFGPLRPTKLTPDEQYTHISLWCLLSAPLLLGCDLEKLDDFTFSLLSNDEVLDVDQDTLGKQAVQVGGEGDLKVYAKPMDDGSLAVGLFNTGATETSVTANWSNLKLTGKQTVRDLWRQKDLGVFDGKFEATVASHGVVLVRIFHDSAK